MLRYSLFRHCDRKTYFYPKWKNLQLDTFLFKIPRATLFYNKDHKGGDYPTKARDFKPSIEGIKEGSKLLLPELIKYKNELKDKFAMDNMFIRRHGDYEIFCKFDNEETINNWVVTSDSDHQEGFSHGKFTLTKKKTGLFTGYVNTDVPKDGKSKCAGYVNVRSPYATKSFYRESAYDWSHYSHMIIRARGDGRPYALLLGMRRYFDLGWLDQYGFGLYTHGGPYWQIAKIPLSKFILNAKGRVQDKQESVVPQLDSISYLGITAADGETGPFQLEIDYIGFVYDQTHKEITHYELYECSPYAHS